MKKFNNRGFILVETVVVSVFVLTIFVLLYQNSIPMVGEYENRIRYDDIDSVYAIGVIRRLLISDPNYNTIIGQVEANGYHEIKCSEISSARQEICRNVFQSLEIHNTENPDGASAVNRVYISKWDVDKLRKDATLPRGFLEYVQYIYQQNEPKLTDYRVILSRTTSYETEELVETAHGEEVKVTEQVFDNFANIGLMDKN